MDCHLCPARLLCPWNFPGKNIGVGFHFLLQGIFPTQGSNTYLLCLLHWHVGSLPAEPPRKPHLCMNELLKVRALRLGYLVYFRLQVTLFHKRCRASMTTHRKSAISNVVSDLFFLVDCIIWKYFLPICRLSFHFAYVSFAVEKLLSLIRSHMFIFAFIFIALGD